MTAVGDLRSGDSARGPSWGACNACNPPPPPPVPPQYVRPLYRLLMATAATRPVAAALFARTAPGYHTVCAKMVRADMEREAAREPADLSTWEVVGE
jgi:hypothetical protein